MFRRPTDEHFIDGGSVYCPLRRRDVEFDLCAGCRWSTSIDLQRHPPVVRCQPVSPPVWLIRPWH